MNMKPISVTIFGASHSGMSLTNAFHYSSFSQSLDLMTEIFLRDGRATYVVPQHIMRQVRLVHARVFVGLQMLQRLVRQTIVDCFACSHRMIESVMVRRLDSEFERRVCAAYWMVAFPFFWPLLSIQRVTALNPSRYDIKTTQSKSKIGEIRQKKLALLLCFMLDPVLSRQSRLRRLATSTALTYVPLYITSMIILHPA